MTLEEYKETIRELKKDINKNLLFKNIFVYSIMSEIVEEKQIELTNFLQECMKYSDHVHMLQVNDLRDQKYINYV